MKKFSLIIFLILTLAFVPTDPLYAYCHSQASNLILNTQYLIPNTLLAFLFSFKQKPAVDIFKKMKNLIFILLINFSFVSYSSAQWYQAYSQPTAQSCFALKFFDNNTGYHSGVLYNGSTFNIYKTTNGGLNWTSQNSGYTAQRFMAIHIIHPDTVFICGNYGKILRTYNGGQNWNTVYSDTNIQFWGMKFVNSNTGFAAGSYGTILKTTNKGDTGSLYQAVLLTLFRVCISLMKIRALSAVHLSS